MPVSSGNPISAFILAGGKGTRMGTDKAALRWGAGTLLDHMSELLAAAADSVRVVGRDPLLDRNPGRGPVEGIATALAATRTRDNLIVAVDLPLLDPTFLRYLALRCRITPADLLVCGSGDAIPLCLGARPSLLADLDAYLDSGKRSFRGFVESVEHDTIDDDALRVNGVSRETFDNINTPDDYERVRRLAGTGDCSGGLSS
jgi:molybdopterin-guanine dinucleotide biosynthesis protein A